ncbi:dual specificity protein phosphatase 3-like [Tigriopus californicus]|nr:dual specificity protein phosphatase 3-like [Tigriopus californicus]
MADIQTLAFSLDTPESAFQPVCGGRRFKRAFSKADFPLLGDEDSKGTPKEHICLTGRSRQLIPKNLSVSVQTVRSWYMDPKTGRWHWPVNGADEVYPGLFLGDESTAMCIHILKDLGIGAVLNTAQGNMTDWSYVNTKASYYQNTGIQFLGIPAIDLKHYPINTHFKETCDFIESVLKKKGRVLVHCVQGISRSATVVLAFLIMRKKLSLKEAIDVVRSKRFIGPNEGFTEQLIELNDQVHGGAKGSPKA